MNRSSDDVDDSIFITGRRLKQTLRRDIATYVEYNTIELDGIILKRVNTAIIDNKKTTYFKCRNMKTPYRVTGVCHFSGRIRDFPDNLEIEILCDHNPNCSYLKKTSINSITSILKNFERIRQEEKYTSGNKKRAIVKKTKKKKKKRNEEDEYTSSESSLFNNKFVDEEDFKISDRDDIVINRLKLPEGIEPNSDLNNSEMYIELWTDADIIKEKKVMNKYPHIFQNISL